ncbi:MAG: FKBP-type peptidyl-prolyl cis-trans isomerase [Actinomycetota bacterium]
MLRRTVPLLIASALLVAACGSDETTAKTSGSPDCPSADVLDEVKVTGEEGQQPVLEFEQPLTVEKTACRVLEEGDGDALESGDIARFDYAFFNARDGSEINTSYGQEPAEVVFNDELMTGVRLGLAGAKEGSRVLVAIAPGDGFEPSSAEDEGELTDEDTLLFIVDLHEIRSPLDRAEGKTVEPVEGLPTVELDEDGAPTITVPDAEPPAELVSQLLIEGDGAVVESGQSITVHYTGVVWLPSDFELPPDAQGTGEVFDSSWTRGTPATFPIGTGDVIVGWDKGLVDQRIGSQVLLVIPPADGYPEGSGSIPAGATLVFVVDILDASA